MAKKTSSPKGRRFSSHAEAQTKRQGKQSITLDAAAKRRSELGRKIPKAEKKAKSLAKRKKLFGTTKGPYILNKAVGVTPGSVKRASEEARRLKKEKKELDDASIVVKPRGGAKRGKMNKQELDRFLFGETRKEKRKKK